MKTINVTRFQPQILSCCCCTNSEVFTAGLTQIQALPCYGIHPYSQVFLLSPNPIYSDNFSNHVVRVPAQIRQVVNTYQGFDV